ncbi:MAG: tetratricopeptide repeat protein [Anaerolineales bacterium]|nr:tetratricopeptide repeat protein [Anaerolineales bacterium]
MRRSQESRPYVLILMAALLTTLLQLSPQPHTTHQALEDAQSAMQAGTPLATAHLLIRAAEFTPWRVDLWIMAGEAALQGGDLQMATACIERAAALGILSADHFLALGDAYLAEGDETTALSLWEQALTTNAVSAQVYTRRAAFYEQHGDYQAAIQDLKAQVVLQPTDAETLYHLGMMLAAFDPESSLAYLAQAAEFQPAYASVSREITRRVNTARLFEEPAYMHLSVGQALAAQGEWELALQAFRQATLIRPDYAEAWAFLGEARQHQPAGSDEGGDGLQELEQAVVLDPDSLAANALMGVYWQRQGDYQQALHYWEKAAETNPGNPTLQVDIAHALTEQGNLASAQQAYYQAIALAPGDPFYWRLLAEFALGQQIQIRQMALPAARQAILLSPDDPASLAVMGKTLSMLGDFLNAERFLRRALEADPSYAPAHLYLGLVYLYRGDGSKAFEELKLAQTLAPGTNTADQANRLMLYYFP